MKSFSYIILVFVFLFFITSCKHSQNDIDTSGTTLNPIQIKRLDKAIFSITAANVSLKTAELRKEYRHFYNRYVNSILNNGGKNDSTVEQNLVRFVQDKDMKTAYAEIQKTYTDKDIEQLASELTEATKRFKVVFPTKKIPQQFITYMSGFNYNVIYVDSTLAIGLDMYLGSNNAFYSMLQYPKFKSRTMTKEHILPDAIRGWLITEFDNADAESKLLNHVIFYGKLFYTAHALIPQVHDSLLFGYSTQQLNYCRTYEKNLWGFFAKDEKLFANDLKIVSEYTGDAPFTASISKECPPRIAMWIGCQIVTSYMEHNEKVSIQELMNEKDSQKILSKSKYKP